MEQSRTFDSVAELYAEVRPDYPAELFDDLRALAGLTAKAVVLEVGCGPGQATRDLADRAGRLVALDPGARLIGAARRRLSRDDVTFVVSSFEEFESPSGCFDLVVSAQAWHWVDQEVGFGKAADLLTPSGFLAVFGHVPTAFDGPFLRPIRLAYDQYAPEAAGKPHPATGYLPDGPIPALFEASGRFGPVTHRGYRWTWTMDATTLGKYLRTDSSYRVLPEAHRFALFDEMSAAVEAAGNAFAAPWETHLYLAQKRRR